MRTEGLWSVAGAPLQHGQASVNRLDDDDDADRIKQMDKSVCLLLRVPMPIVDPPEFATTHRPVICSH